MKRAAEQLVKDPVQYPRDEPLGVVVLPRVEPAPASFPERLPSEVIELLITKLPAPHQAAIFALSQVCRAFHEALSPMRSGEATIHEFRRALSSAGRSEVADVVLTAVTRMRGASMHQQPAIRNALIESLRCVAGDAVAMPKVIDTLLALAPEGKPGSPGDAEKQSFLKNLLESIGADQLQEVSGMSCAAKIVASGLEPEHFPPTFRDEWEKLQRRIGRLQEGKDEPNSPLVAANLYLLSTTEWQSTVKLLIEAEPDNPGKRWALRSEIGQHARVLPAGAERRACLQLVFDRLPALDEMSPVQRAVACLCSEVAPPELVAGLFDRVWALALKGDKDAADSLAGLMAGMHHDAAKVCIDRIWEEGKAVLGTDTPQCACVLGTLIDSARLLPPEQRAAHAKKVFDALMALDIWEDPPEWVTSQVTQSVDLVAQVPAPDRFGYLLALIGPIVEKVGGDSEFFGLKSLVHAVGVLESAQRIGFFDAIGAALFPRERTPELTQGVTAMASSLHYLSPTDRDRWIDKFLFHEVLLGESLHYWFGDYHAPAVNALCKARDTLGATIETIMGRHPRFPVAGGSDAEWGNSMLALAEGLPMLPPDARAVAIDGFVQQARFFASYDSLVRLYGLPALSPKLWLGDALARAAATGREPDRIGVARAIVMLLESDKKGHYLSLLGVLRELVTSERLPPHVGAEVSEQVKKLDARVWPESGPKVEEVPSNDSSDDS
ncbi:MAG: F-box protein [Pseudomonadota bacterium]